MTKGLAIMLALAGAAALPGEAFAQRTGTRMGGVEARAPSNAVDQDDIRRFVADYAGCLLRNNRGNVEAYLATSPNAPESERRFRLIRDENCIQSGSLTLSGDGFRAAAYGELYRIDFGARGPTDFSGTAAVDYARSTDAGVTASPAYLAVRSFYDCVVRSAPAQARALALTRIGSVEESRAVTPLVPHLRRCLPEGQEVTFSRPGIRALVTEVLYRLSRAPAAAPAAGGAQ